LSVPIIKRKSLNDRFLPFIKRLLLDDFVPDIKRKSLDDQYKPVIESDEELSLLRTS
jgi:hypothetical protein